MSLIMTDKPYKDKETEIVDCDSKVVTTDRWALDSGLATVTMQETLVYYGYLAHEKTIDVLVIINPKEKRARYMITLSVKEHKRYEKFKKQLKKYEDSGDITRKEQFLISNFKIDLESNLQKLIHDYLPKLQATVTIKEKKLLPRWLAKVLGLKAYIKKYNEFF